ncbi:MAG: riboflavin synthase [Cyanobacteriota bacterium]|nr:riboflavin synthase [Cyanobacteriota bacterium]
MFTGLIQRLGSLRILNDSQVKITCPGWIDDLEMGDSIAVDGVCLTVTHLFSDGFTADVSPETLQRSTLGLRREWDPSIPVNLEASLRVGQKVGGHFVTGHIDGMGYLMEKAMTGEAWLLTFQAPSELSRHIVEKGSIAVNGISLTVASLMVVQVQPPTRYFQVAVIPHSYQSTNLAHLQVGDPVNLEGDILSKYVEGILLGKSPSLERFHPAPSEPLSLSFLAEHGYS